MTKKIGFIIEAHRGDAVLREPYHLSGAKAAIAKARNICNNYGHDKTTLDIFYTEKSYPHTTKEDRHVGTVIFAPKAGSGQGTSFERGVACP